MTTPRLGAPELVSGQATPETTVNEQIRYLESGAGHFIFKDRDLATPPGSPADGDSYLVAASPTGAWTGKAGSVAFYLNTAWVFITPREGFTAWVNDEDVFVGYDGSLWNTLSAPSGAYQPLDSDLTSIAALTTTSFGRGLLTSADAAALRSSGGATTAGGNLFTITNPSAITFLRFNADNSVSALSASSFRTAIGAGTGGGDLVSTNNLSDLASASTARTNLGLGSAALLASSAVAQTANNLSDLASASTARTNLGLGSIAVEAEATAAQIQAGTASKAVAADKLLAAATPQTLTDGATVAWDMSLGFNAKVTIAGNRTLTVSNPVLGLDYSLAVIQDGAGSRTMTWPASFDWGTTGAPTLTTTASKVDQIVVRCTDAATPKFRAYLAGKGFAS